MDGKIRIDGRTESGLLEDIRKKSASYVPEWRFDMEQPDVGTGLACIFARMHQGTLEQLNRVPEKLETEFFNSLNTSMRAAAPAAGYVSFGLVNDFVAGTELPAGTLLTTEQKDENGEDIPLETKDDVYVSPVMFSAVYESFDGDDHIACLYEEGKEVTPFPLFGMSGENLQKHEFYMGHPSVFSIRGGAVVELSFYINQGKPVEERFLEALADPKKAVFSYSLSEDYVEFDWVYVKNGKLCLVKRADQPAWEEQEREGILQRWIRVKLWDAEELKDFGFRRAAVSSSADLLLPDAVFGGGAELSRRECFPFGEQFSVYDEVYFGSDEAFSKAGALIQFSFQREFVKVPLNLAEGQRDPDWKLIMRKNQFQVEREFDITIGEVIWEYYNGSGWTRLFGGREYGDVFGIETGIYRQRVVMVFNCPGDIAPILVGGVESRYIRARIRKVNNAFKTQGQYITPLITETWFKYQYQEDGAEPVYLGADNNLETRMAPASAYLGKTYPFYPFSQAGDRQAAVYFGTEMPWERGPIRILWETEELKEEKAPSVVWEYFAGGRWKELNPADGTAYFRRTGLLTFSGPSEASRHRLFGRELYWLRVRECEGNEEERAKTVRPVIRNWHYNSVRIWAVRSGLEEMLTLEKYRENPEFTLLNRGIHQLELWVDETESLGSREREGLKEAGELKEVLDRNGKPERYFVRWKERDNLALSGRNDRHYVLDANEGKLFFGDGINGRLPAPGVLNGIRAEYSIGGGTVGNLEAGRVNGLDLSLGFINQVTNPLPLAGGYDRENAAEAMRRRAGELKHRFRAVTASDYEKLALEASGSVERAACRAGYDQNGSRKPGHVTLLLLQKNFETEGHFFPELKEQVAGYMADKIPVGLAQRGRFHIEAPEFVEIGVSADLWVSGYNNIFECRRQAEEGLARFLNPVCGNFMGNGWEIGRLPSRNQIDTLLKSISLIRDIRNLVIVGVVRVGGTRAEVSLDDMKNRPFVLPVCGEIKIRIHTE